MKTTVDLPLSDDIPDILRDELARTRPLTPEMLAELAAANRAIVADPAFQADFLKALFVNEMLAALDERKETKATLAERLGKTRQYIQKLFNEDKRVNFTVDTLCAVAHALGRRVHLHVCREHEQPAIVTRPRAPVMVKARSWERPTGLIRPALRSEQFVKSRNAPTAPTRKEVQFEHPIAA